MLWPGLSSEQRTCCRTSACPGGRGYLRLPGLWGEQWLGLLDTPARECTPTLLGTRPLLAFAQTANLRCHAGSLSRAQLQSDPLYCIVKRTTQNYRLHMAMIS